MHFLKISCLFPNFTIHPRKFLSAEWFSIVAWLMNNLAQTAHYKIKKGM